MWVLLALFWTNTADPEFINARVYGDYVFNDYETCQTILLDNREKIVDSISKINQSGRFSVKCVDANKYPQIKYMFEQEKTI